MSPRTGRPLSNNPKDIRVETRMTVDELEKLDECCRVAEKSRSEIIRAGIELIHANLHKLKKE